MLPLGSVVVVAGLSTLSASDSEWLSDHWSAPPHNAEELAVLRRKITGRSIELDPLIYGDGWLESSWWDVARRDDPDDVLQHTFTFFAYRFQAPPDIDWNEKLDAWDPEFNWWMNRFLFLKVLSERTIATGDRKYVRKGFDLMLDWVRKNPVEQAAQAWAAWRSLEVGLRLAYWIPFLATHARDPEVLSDVEWNLLLRSMWEQANYLKNVSGPGRNNWGLMEMAGLGMTALFCPELNGSQEWLEFVWDTQTKDAELQLYPDGSQVEMSPIYEVTVMLSFLKTAHLAKQLGRPVPAPVTSAICRTAGYLARVRHPDGSLPAHNDGDLLNLDRLLAAALREFGAEDLQALWLVTRGQEGRSPADFSWFFPYSGVAAYRDGFSSESMYLHFDTGPFGVAHQHEDALSIEFWFNNQMFIIEPGRYHYVNSPMRAYLVSSLAHSTISVDGAGQQARSFPDRWRCTDPLSGNAQTLGPIRYVEGTYALGYSAPSAGAVIHRRRVFFVDAGYVLLVDEITGEGTHEIDARLQFAPIDITLAGDGSGLSVRQADGATVRVRWVGQEPLGARLLCGVDEPKAGWVSFVYGAYRPAPQLSLVCKATLPFTMTTLLAPVRDGESETSLVLQPSGDNTAGVTVQHDGAEDRYRLYTNGASVERVGKQGGVTFVTVGEVPQVEY